jgi:hypothetical protein
MGLNINIETKHNPYYNKFFLKLREDLDCNQMYTFVLNHDYKF